MRYKIILMLMSLFLFIPILKAQETYYDYEKVKVSELPTASEETINKVYQIDKTYYVTNKINSNYTPLPLNEDLNGKTIYIIKSENIFININSFTI